MANIWNYATLNTYSRWFSANLTDARLNEVTLLATNARMFGWFFEAQPKPDYVPYKSDSSIEIERSLPTKILRKQAGHWQADHGSSVRSAKG